MQFAPLKTFPMRAFCCGTITFWIHVWTLLLIRRRSTMQFQLLYGVYGQRLERNNHIFSFRLHVYQVFVCVHCFVSNLGISMTVFHLFCLIYSVKLGNFQVLMWFCTVDGYRRCEKWMHNDVVGPKESKTTSWFKRFIGRKKKPELTWPFPFAEGKMFILTVRAGLEGYHINVGGRHVTSFPYRTVC